MLFSLSLQTFSAVHTAKKSRAGAGLLRKRKQRTLSRPLFPRNTVYDYKIIIRILLFCSSDVLQQELLR